MSTNSKETNPIHELKAELSHLKGSERLKALTELSRHYLSRDPQQALDYGQEALNLALEFDNPSAIANCHRTIGIVYISLGKLEKAREATQKSLEIELELGDTQRLAYSFSNLGLIQAQLGHNELAIEAFIKALDMAEALDDQLTIASAHINLGNLHYMEKNLDKAMTHYSLSLPLLESLDDRQKISKISNNLGLVLADMDRFEEALTHHQRSMTIREELEDIEGLAASYMNVGVLHQKLKQFDRALDFHQKSLAMFEKLGNQIGQSRAYCNLGAVRTVNKNYQQAFQNFQQALALMNGNSPHELQIEIYDWLTHLFEEQGYYQEALTYHRQYAQLKDTLYDLEKVNQMTKIESQYNAKKQEAEIQRLKNVDLARVNQQLQEAIDEKNEILSIVTHDIKNPLTAIIGSAQILQEFQLRKLQMQKIGVSIELSAKRILELVQSFLDIQQVESGRRLLQLAPVDVSMAIESSVTHHQQAAMEKGIRLQFKPPSHREHALADDQALHQVLDNLISNAIKFSYPNSCVSIELTADDEKLTVAIQDQGQGLSADDMKYIFGKFARLSAQPTGGEHSTGLGLSIVKKLVEAMQGQVQAKSDGMNKGATFLIQLKKAQSRSDD